MRIIHPYQVGRRRPRDRRGNIVVLSALMLVGFTGCIAFAVDVGFMLSSKTELQRAADAAALAATWELIAEGDFDDEDPNLTLAIASARQVAVDYAAENRVAASAPAVNLNSGNSVDGEIVVGRLPDPYDPASVMTYNDTSTYNAVTVRVRRNENQNGEVALFFANLFGIGSAAMEAEATAVMFPSISGFKTPGNGSNLGILPFALDEDTWNDLLAGNTTDSWSWDKGTGTVGSGGDGILEVNLYPQGTDSPGNRGTVDIGSNNNSTNDIARQILHGVTPADLAYHNGSLTFNDQGFLYLNGDTGISAGVKDELASIIGEPRMIPIFRTVTGNGNNAQYQIVKFVGIRILEVKLTGQMSSKRVIIQPAAYVTDGAIPSSDTTKSDMIFTSVYLVR